MKKPPQHLLRWQVGESGARALVARGLVSHSAGGNGPRGPDAWGATREFIQARRRSLVMTMTPRRRLLYLPLTVIMESWLFSVFGLCWQIAGARFNVGISRIFQKNKSINNSQLATLRDGPLVRATAWRVIHSSVLTTYVHTNTNTTLNRAMGVFLGSFFF